MDDLPPSFIIHTFSRVLALRDDMLNRAHLQPCAILVPERTIPSRALTVLLGIPVIYTQDPKVTEPSLVYAPPAVVPGHVFSNVETP